MYRWNPFTNNLDEKGDWFFGGNTLGSKKTIGSIDNQDFGIITNNSERITVLKNGKVGIGTTAPLGTLDVRSGKSFFGVTSDPYPGGDNNAFPITVGGTAGIAINTTAPNNSTSGVAIGVAVKGDSFLRTLFYSNGNMGYGPGNATRDVYIGRTSSNTFGIFGAYDGSGTGNFTVSGNVGIGTTAPTEKLDVNGNIKKGLEKSIVPGISFTQIADKTIGNTTTETSMFSTGVGSLNIPANSLVAGRTYRIKLKGYASGINGDTSTIKVKIGTTELVSSTGAWQTLTDIGFTLEFDFTCRTTGATGTIAGNGYSLVSGGQGFSTVSMRALLAGTDTINTTASQDIDLTYQWSSANTGNTITITNASIEVLN